MLCILYTRVSTGEQAKKGYSPEEQIDAGLAHAAKLGYARDQVIVIEEPGVTSELMEERPGLTRARELVRAGGVGHLIARDLFRLARELLHQMILMKEFKTAGCKVEFTTLDWEDTPEGRMFVQFFALIGEYQRESTRRLTMEHKIAKARKGGIAYPARIDGYIYDKESDTFSIDPARADVVRLIYKWFTEDGKSIYGIVDDLNAAGLTTMQGARWITTQVRRVLRNEAYSGRYVQRKWNMTGMRGNKYKPKGEKIPRRPRPAEEQIPVPIPAVVSEDTWRRAQELLDARPRSGRRIESYLLSGLGVCGVCGRPLSGYRATRRGGKHARYYVCTGRMDARGEAKCILPYLPAETLEAIVWERVEAAAADPDLLLEEMRRPAGPDRSLEAALAETQLDELAKERARLISLYQRGHLDDAEMDNLMAEVDRRRQAAMEIRRAAMEAAPAAVDEAAIRRSAERAAQCSHDADFETRRGVIVDMVRRVVVSLGKIEVQFGPAETGKRFTNQA